jgi:hypothetical protein
VKPTDGNAYDKDQQHFHESSSIRLQFFRLENEDFGTAFAAVTVRL